MVPCHLLHYTEKQWFFLRKSILFFLVKYSNLGMSHKTVSYGIGTRYCYDCSACKESQVRHTKQFCKSATHI